MRRPAIPADAEPQAGLYHLAWAVGTLAELGEIRRAHAARGVLVGASDHRVSQIPVREASPGRRWTSGRPGQVRRVTRIFDWACGSSSQSFMNCASRPYRSASAIRVSVR